MNKIEYQNNENHPQTAKSVGGLIFGKSIISASSVNPSLKIHLNFNFRFHD
ncbi:hypothetical protein ABHD89_001050 [Salinicoccus halitifaciens]|uniref:Uncharacterized protein n=1 Tax=Salinicoccus halitifaciens TaxID=1073415 RepID=A0ABV2E899_9STAP